MLRYRALFLLLLTAACGDPKADVGVYAGTHGATVAVMTARGVRLSRAASDVRFDARPAARGIVATGQLTDTILRASLDSMATDQEVIAVLSRFLTRGATGAIAGFNQAGVPYISTTPIASRHVGGSTWGFSLVPDYRKQAAFIAQNVGSGKRPAIVHIDDEYGRGLGAALRDALTQAGSAPIEVRAYQQAWDEPRMIAAGHEVKNKNPDVLVFAGRAPSLTLIIQPFREAGAEIRTIGTDLVETEHLYGTGDATLAGVEFVRFMDVKSEDPRMKDLADRYVFWIGFGRLTTESVLTHDGVALIGEALRAGARTRAQVRDYLKTLGRSRPPYSGVGGLIAFGDDGQVDRKMHLARITNSGVVPREAPTDSAADRR